MSADGFSTPIGSRVDVHPSGKAQVSGIDYGPLRFLHVDKRCLVLRNEGHSSWSAVGQTAYRPPRLLVFRVLDVHTSEHSPTAYSVEPLIEIPLGRGALKARTP